MAIERQSDPVDSRFDTTNPSTWPVILTIEQVGAIYLRKPGGIRKSCQRHAFTPAPMATHPYRWRKADVLRHIEGGRAVLRQMR
jgi:hypothetical protein